MAISTRWRDVRHNRHLVKPVRQVRLVRPTPADTEGYVTSLILEAFSHVLKHEHNLTRQPPQLILHRWLLAMLVEPPADDPCLKPADSVPIEDTEDTGTETIPDTVVKKVLQTEFNLHYVDDYPIITAASASGQRLLSSLQWYCDSYEQWQFRRWLHQAQVNSFTT